MAEDPPGVCEEDRRGPAGEVSGSAHRRAWPEPADGGIDPGSGGVVRMKVVERTKVVIGPWLIFLVTQAIKK